MQVQAQFDYHANAVFGVKGQFACHRHGKRSIGNPALFNDLKGISVDEKGISAGIGIVLNLNVIHHAACLYVPEAFPFMKQTNTFGWNNVDRPDALIGFGSILRPFVRHK